MDKRADDDRLLNWAFWTVWNKRRVQRWLTHAFWFFTAVLAGRIAAKIVYWLHLGRY